MLRTGLVLALIGACAARPRPPPAVEIPPWAWVPKLRQPVVDALRGPHPELALDHLQPDLRHALHWPLAIGAHPQLAPTYPIALVFAQPGVGWADLCVRGVTARASPSIHRAFVDYLRAWCQVANRDLDVAVATFGQLRTVAPPALADAVRLDLANVLADAGPGDQALRTLARAGIDDLALDDLLAATYAEVGSLDDAAQFNELALAGAAREPAVACRRLTRRAVLAGPANALPSIVAIHRQATNHGDATCARLENELRCWSSVERECRPYFADVAVPAREVFRYLAYAAWPKGEARAPRWWAIARDALEGMPLPGADWMAAVALDRAVRTTSCGAPIQAQYAFAARQVLDQVGHDPALDPVLHALIDDQTWLCSPRFGPALEASAPEDAKP